MRFFDLFVLIGALHVSNGERAVGGGGEGGGCASDAECDEARACLNERCADPCWGACGLRARCLVRRHNPECSCPAPLVGDPYTACGNLTDHTYEASVLVAAESAEEGADEDSECASDVQCGSERACVDERCVDPCRGACALDAECVALRHAAHCFCRASYSGDPYVHCTRYEGPLNISHNFTSPPILPMWEEKRRPTDGLESDDDEGEKQLVPVLWHAEVVTLQQQAGMMIEETVTEWLPIEEGGGGERSTTRIYGEDDVSSAPAPSSPPPSLPSSPPPPPPLPSWPPPPTDDVVSAAPAHKTAASMSSYDRACEVPPAPAHGAYWSEPPAPAGSALPWLYVNVTCEPGFGVVGDALAVCSEGRWTGPLPTCVRMCSLEPDPSVEYRCLVAASDASGVGAGGHRACRALEPAGTIVNPRCRRPNYYAAEELYFMRCNAGHWNYVAKCTPECGKVTPSGVELVMGGAAARRGELPWHAGIYSKNYRPYLQVCGGSLVSPRIVISAAHCFWRRDAPLPASSFALAVGKLYRPWDNRKDDAQKSDVVEVRLPPRFQGAGANFQDDIAVVMAARPFRLQTFVRPVCLSFDVDIERMPQSDFSLGKVAGWGLTAENGNASAVLKVIDLPYVEVATCIRDLPYSFREFITSDKICAGTRFAGEGLCRGDSGGGLAFAVADRGAPRYFLHGVVSAAPNAEDAACSTDSYTAFTQVTKHELFIKQFWNERDDAVDAEPSSIQASESAAMSPIQLPLSPDGDDFTPEKLPPGIPFVSYSDGNTNDDIRPKFLSSVFMSPAPLKPDLEDEDSTERSEDPCSSAAAACGAHGVCRAHGGLAACACAPGYVGAPPACRACSHDAECARTALCAHGVCMDACARACGTGARCVVLDHVPVCSCAPGLTGDPFARCTPTPEEDVSAAPSDPCSPSPCGAHGVCRAVGGHAACACARGYFGLPPRCRGCALDAECPRGRACVRGVCVDPCRGACGARAACLVPDHVPVCSCAPGLSGDPFTQCAPEEEPETSHPAVLTRQPAQAEPERSAGAHTSTRKAPASPSSLSRGRQLPSQTINTTTECGRVWDRRAPAPWHCAIYRQRVAVTRVTRVTRVPTTLVLHCAGTLLTPRHVISAARCFWDEMRGGGGGGGMLEGATHFAVGVSAPAQTLPVEFVWVPSWFGGAAQVGAGAWLDTIAVLSLTRAARVSRAAAAPLCLCAEGEGLSSGGGRLAVWEEGHSARAVELEAATTCAEVRPSAAPESRRVRVTPDAVCASGAVAGGTGVAGRVRDGTRYCLLGVVSASPPAPLPAYMPLREHGAFIRQILEHR